MVWKPKNGPKWEAKKALRTEKNNIEKSFRNTQITVRTISPKKQDISKQRPQNQTAKTRHCPANANVMDRPQRREKRDKRRGGGPARSTKTHGDQQEDRDDKKASKLWGIRWGPSVTTGK